MPYKKEKDHPQCPTDKPIGVVKESDGELMGCHASETSADDQIAALYAAEEEECMKLPAIAITVQEGLIEGFAELEAGIHRFIERVTREWDGSVSNYDTTDAYCSACLIDVNPDGEDKVQSMCMLPVKAPGSDSYDFEGIQAAGGHGISQVQKPDGVDQGEWDAAVKSAANTIIAQYDENDKTAPDSVYEAAGKEPPKSQSTIDLAALAMTPAERAMAMSQLFSQVDTALMSEEGWPWLIDLFMEDQELFAVATSGGKLYKYPLDLSTSTPELGEAQEVEYTFSPITGQDETPRTRTTVFRDTSGAWRWVSISCTAILNRVGEIDTRALFDSMIAHAEETGEYPYRTFYHCGEELAYGRCDYLARDGYTLITSGVFDTTGPNKEIALAEIEAREKDPETWGESIGFIPTAPPVWVEVAENIRVATYNQGIMREVSCVLESEAAALFTQSTTQEVSRMLDKIKDRLAQLGVKQDKIDDLEAKTDATNRSIEDDGLIAREIDQAEEETEEEEVETEEAEEEEEIEVESLDVEVGEEVLDDVAGRAVARLLDPSSEFMGVLADLTEAVESLRTAQEATNTLLDGRISALEETDEEKRERWTEDLPRSTPARLIVRPRTKEAGPDEQTEVQDSSAKVAETLGKIPTGYYPS